MPRPGLLVLALLVVASAAVRADDSASPDPDQGFQVCRDADDSRDCAAHAREVAKEHVGHGEGLAAYARACRDLIDQAVTDDSSKLARAEAAQASYEKMRDQMKPFCAGGRRAATAATAPPDDWDVRADARGVKWLCPPSAPAPSEEEQDAERSYQASKAALQNAREKHERLLKHQREARSIYEDRLSKKLIELKDLQDEVDGAERMPGSEGSDAIDEPGFNSYLRQRILALEKTDDAMDEDLRAIVKLQQKADPKSNCDPALRNPDY